MQQRATIAIPGDPPDSPSIQRLTVLLETFPGVISVFVGLQTEMAYIVYDPDQVNLRWLQLLIERQSWRFDVNINWKYLENSIHHHKT